MNRAFASAPCVLSVLLAAAATGSAADVRVRTVAATGLRPPGTADGVTYRNFGSLPLDRVAFNDNHTLAFCANLNGPDIVPGNDIGLWAEIGGGPLQLLIREGDPAPGFSPDVVLASGIRLLDISSADHLLFETYLAGPGVTAANNNTIWLRRNGQFELVAREGDAPPGVPAGQTFGDFFSFVPGAARVDAAGSVLIRATTQAHNGIWRWSAGLLTPVAVSGQPAPGFSDGVVFASVEVPWRLSDAGDAAFLGTVSGPGIDTTNHRAIWLYSGGQVTLIVPARQQAPGMPDGVLISNSLSIYPRPRVEYDGLTTMNLTLTGSGVSSTNDTIIYRGGPGGLTPLLREGDPVPDNPGEVFRTFVGAYWTSVGGTLLMAQVDTGAPAGYSGLWLHRSDGLRLLHRTGETPPELPFPINFAGFSNEDDNYPPAARMTNSGHYAFAARIVGGGVNGANDRGLWATDPQRRMRLVLREGDLIELSPGNAQQVTYVGHPVINESRTIAESVVLLGNLAPQAILSITVGCPQPQCDGFDLAGEDCVVNLSDLAVLLSAFGTSGVNLAGDIDGDGSIGLPDLAAFLSSFGADCN